MRMMLALGLSACLATAGLIGQARSAADMYQEGLQLEEVKGDLQKELRTQPGESHTKRTEIITCVGTENCSKKHRK